MQEHLSGAYYMHSDAASLDGGSWQGSGAAYHSDAPATTLSGTPLVELKWRSSRPSGKAKAYALIASAVGVSGASCLAPGSSQGAIDAKLLTGAALFGLGWGTGGVCPGPQLVSLAADPTAPGLLLMLAAVAVGIRLAGATRAQTYP